MIFNMSTKTIQWRKEQFCEQFMLGQLNIHTPMKLDPYHTPYKNQFKIDHRLNIKHKNIKLLKGYKSLYP